MNTFLIGTVAVAWLVILAYCWFGWQLLHQNGRFLLRLEEVEKRLDELQFGEDDESGVDQSLVASAATNGDGGAREERFSKRSLHGSKIKRDGLKAGAPAPDFRLPRLEGRGEISLSDLRGNRVLLVFSDPHCGPCNALAPELEKFHRHQGTAAGSPSPGGEGRGKGEFIHSLQVLMISRGDPKENCAKVKEHGLTFPIVLQQQWEISRRYAMFATPIAYLIDEQGVILKDVALGVEAIQALMTEAMDWSRADPSQQKRFVARQERGDLIESS